MLHVKPGPRMDQQASAPQWVNMFDVKPGPLEGLALRGVKMFHGMPGPLEGSTC